MRVAVVGHVEWVQFAPVDRIPAPGQIAHARHSWEQAAGGGAVAAVQLAKLAGECLFYTALGDDDNGHAALKELQQLGVRVQAAWRKAPQRRAFVLLDSSGERTITTIGQRLQPQGDDPLPWAELKDVDAVYLTAADPAAIRLARAARTLISTPRALPSLSQAKQQIDVLVCSSADPGERYQSGDLDPPPSLIARTEGAAGGALQFADGSVHRWEAVPPPGIVVDSYGAGDCFAAGLTYALAQRRPPQDAAALGARCGAACIAGSGPYSAQLRSP